jgi:hypothetical protein
VYAAVSVAKVSTANTPCSLCACTLAKQKSALRQADALMDKFTAAAAAVAAEEHSLQEVELEDAVTGSISGVTTNGSSSAASQRSLSAYLHLLTEAEQVQ